MYLACLLIWNFDQSLFEYEISSDRTLSWRGERDTVIQVDQANKATHSFTIQPLVSRYGRTIGKLLACSQERGGNFGPRVNRSVHNYEDDYRNIHALCSTSGKMSLGLMGLWLDRIVLPTAASYLRLESRYQNLNHTDEEPIAGPSGDYQGPFDRPRMLILGDSWAGNTNQRIVNKLAQKRIAFLQVPEGTTSKLQPLDVSFFRQYKLFVKRIFLQLNLEGRQDLVTTRQGALNMHSLVWNQFSAAPFADLIRYGWQNADIDFNQRELMRNKREFTVNSINFGHDPSEHCEVEGCNEYAYIRCAHCQKLLCIHHFLNRTCYHDVDLEVSYEELRFRNWYDLDDDADDDFDMDPLMSDEPEINDLLRDQNVNQIYPWQGGNQSYSRQGGNRSFPWQGGLDFGDVTPVHRPDDAMSDDGDDLDLDLMQRERIEYSEELRSMCTTESYVDDHFYPHNNTNFSPRPPTINQRNDTFYPRANTSFSPRPPTSRKYHTYDLESEWIIPKSKKLFHVSVVL